MQFAMQLFTIKSISTPIFPPDYIGVSQISVVSKHLPLRRSRKMARNLLLFLRNRRKEEAGGRSQERKMQAGFGTTRRRSLGDRHQLPHVCILRSSRSWRTNNPSGKYKNCVYSLLSYANISTPTMNAHPFFRFLFLKTRAWFYCLVWYVRRQLPERGRVLPSDGLRDQERGAVPGAVRGAVRPKNQVFYFMLCGCQKKKKNAVFLGGGVLNRKAATR